MKHFTTYINEFLVKGHTQNTTSYDSLEYVDLDLPSGTLWATMSIGSKTPEDFGDHFMFGDVKPSDSCCWKYCPANGNHNDYNRTSFFENIKDFLDDEWNIREKFDAASNMFGDGSHIPTADQCIELYRNTKHKYIDVDSKEYEGIDGWKLMSRLNPDKSIFMPLDGIKKDSQLEDIGKRFVIWTSTMSKQEPKFAYAVEGDYHSVGLIEQDRCTGCSIRPVKDR